MKRHEIVNHQFPGGADMMGGETGYVVGARGESLLRFDTDTHFMTLSSTGGGKGTAVVIPNLLVHPGSVLSVEIGGASLISTVNYRRDVLKQKIFVLDPFHQTDFPSASWNVLDTLDPNNMNTFENGVKDIVKTIMKNEDGKKEKDVFFHNTAAELLQALIVYVKTASDDEVSPEDRHLPYVADLLSLYGSDRPRWEEVMQRLATDTGPFRQIMNEAGGYLTGNVKDSHYGSIVKTASQWLSFARNASLARYMKKTDLQLSDLRNDKISIYVVMSEVEDFKNNQGWLRLLIRRAINACPASRDAGKGFKYEDRILFMLDEFTNLGELEEFSTGMLTVRQKGITLWALMQDKAVLDLVYGENRADSMLGSAACIQVFSVGDLNTMRYVSEKVGKNIMMIPNPSVALNENITDTISTSYSFTSGESFAKQHGLTKGTTETWSETVTVGTMQSVSNAFSSGGQSGSSFSGGQMGSNSGLNWSSSRAVTTGSNESNAKGKSDARQESVNTSDTNTTNTQKTDQNSESRAVGRGVTVTYAYAPQIVPKLEPAEVETVLAPDDAQMLLLRTRSGAKRIIDGRAYYYKIPMLRARALGPDAPALPSPLRPLEGPLKLKSGMEGARPQVYLPAAPIQVLRFPQFHVPSESLLEEILVPLNKGTQTISVSQLRELYNDAAKDVVERKKKSGRFAKYSPGVKRAEKREALLRECFTEAKLSAIYAADQQKDHLESAAKQNVNDMREQTDHVRAYQRSLAGKTQEVMGQVPRLEKSQGRLLMYENKLRDYAHVLKSDIRTDESFFSEVPEFLEYAEYYHMLRENWTSLAEPKPPVLVCADKFLAHANTPIELDKLLPEKMEKKTFQTANALPQEPTLSVSYPHMPEYSKFLDRWKTWVDPNSTQKDFTFSAVENEIEHLRLDLDGGTFSFAAIKRRLMSIVGSGPSRKELREHMALLCSAKDRLVDKAFLEATKELKQHVFAVGLENGRIEKSEGVWADYYKKAQLQASHLAQVTDHNARAYDGIEQGLSKLHAHRDRLHEANLAVCGGRAKKVLEVASWDVWDRCKLQTLRLGIQVNDNMEIEAPARESQNGCSQTFDLGVKYAGYNK